MTIPDFSFDARKSYSPLLAALAEAPLNKAKMAIAQEQNQRQRLSDLLSNISSAATTARNVQLIHQQSVEQKAREDSANQMNSQNKNLYLGNPAFQQSFGGMAGTGAGIDTMFGGTGAQPQAPSQPPLAGEGVTANNQNSPSMGVDPQALIRKMKLKAVGVTYHTETNPATGEQYQVPDAPIGIPPEKLNYPTSESSGVSGAQQLPPKLMEVVGNAKKDFQSRPDVVTNIGNLNLLDQLEGAVKENNPAAIQNIKAGRMESGGIPGGRASSAAMAGEFGSKAYSSQFGRWWEQAWSGKLPEKDQKQFLDQIRLQRNVSAKQLVDAHSSTAGDVSKQYGIALPIAKRGIGQGMESQLSKYDPKLKAQPLSVDEVKVGDVYNGHRYKGGDKTKQNSWVKVK